MTTTITGATGIDNIKAATGAVLQVKQYVMSAKQVVASATYVDVLTLAITPSSTSSKILINFSISVGSAGGGEGSHIQIERGGTAIGVGDVRGNRGRAFSVCGEQTSDDAMGSASGMYLDSPSSTSSLTYTIAVHGWAAAYPVNINCTGNDTNNANYAACVSTLTLQEIAG
jgi:hypothetical protein